MGAKGTREARGKMFVLLPDVGPDGKLVCLRAGSTEHPDCCEWVGGTVLSHLSTVGSGGSLGTVLAGATIQLLK